MKFGLNKIRAVFGDKQSMKQTQVENQIDDIIKSIDEEAFAISEQNVLFGRTSELGGYYYAITIIVGSFKIKTNKGAKLVLKGHNFDLTLNSDMDEFESNHSNASKRHITRIDFQIEKKDVAKFDKKKITSLTLSVKKQEVVFKTL
ncbi:hypothetical protein [uncultured Algibacter sp.]|uniref:hypothetical protein n=1 Tax=uncultured Algibacter sp. TaxID=298659 RepID=UPI00260B20A2|nr:hypothetical protein [uncultured Algibacter sp.]